MRRFASLLALTCLGALSAPALAQTENLPAVPAQAIGAAAKSCGDALSAAGVDDKRLVTDGWKESKLESADAQGKPVASPLRIFSRDPGVLVLLEAQSAQDRVVCILLARIASAADYKPSAEAIQAALSGQVAAAREAAVLVAFPENKMAEIAPAGSADKPAIRILMMQLPKRN